MDSPKVSIIVPCFKVEKYLDRCMHSLINQTFGDIEIILVDDKSPDKTPQLCDDWANKDSRVKVVHKPVNEGLGFARNTGIEVAIGDYIMFLDSDDTYELNACERLYWSAIKHDADVVAGNFITETQPGKWAESTDYETDTVMQGDDITEYTLDMIACGPGILQDRIHPVSVCLLCIRRRTITDNNLKFMSEREIASEDTLFKISLLKCCRRLLCLNFPFYHYFLNGTSLTHSYNKNSFSNLKRLRSELVKASDGNHEFLPRIDRFIISDIRSNISRLVGSNESNKKHLVKEILNDNIWNSIDNFSPSDFKSTYARLFHTLCKWNKPLLVLSLVKCAYIARKILRH